MLVTPAADVLAKHASVNAFHADAFWQAFRDEMTLPSLWVQSFWLLYRQDLRPYWHGTTLQLPSPVKEWDAQVATALSTWEEKLEEPMPAGIDGLFVSCNVMTFKQHHISTYAAVSAFLQSCCRKNVALLAVQETRLKKLAFYDEQYMIRNHPAHKGQGGMLLALHPDLFKIYDAHGHRVHLLEQHWTVVASGPEYMVTRLWCGPVDVLIANLHVPHSGNDDGEIQKYWTDLQQLIPGHLRGKHMILLGDMNARLGSVQSAGIGGHACEEESFAGGLLHNHVLQWKQWIPATFEHHQFGPTSTWVHPGGSESRIDYIAVPLEWHYRDASAWVDLELQAHSHLHDHRATCLKVHRLYVSLIRTGHCKLWMTVLEKLSWAKPFCKWPPSIGIWMCTRMLMSLQRGFIRES